MKQEMQTPAIAVKMLQAVGKKKYCLHFFAMQSGNLQKIMGGIDDVDVAMDSMTTSMTDVMHSTGFTIPGKAFREETYIHVRWAWIILPMLAALFSIMFLIATVTTSRKLNTVLWKDSVLPLLMFWRQADSAEDIESLSIVSEAERVSRNINVFCGEKGSLVFSEVKDGLH